MKLSRLLATALLLPLAALPAQDSTIKKNLPYESHYLVFGDRAANQSPVILALDFNRTDAPNGTSTYEYKGWQAVGPAWTMFLYRVWTAPTPAPGAPWPTADGVQPEVRPDGTLRITVAQPDRQFTLATVPASAAFATEKDRLGAIRTTHPATTWSRPGQPDRIRPAVYEQVIYDQSPGRANAEEAGERHRSLDTESFFGDYDWIVLWDESGRLWQVSAGPLTEDFAYHLAAPDEAAVQHDVTIRWQRTVPDEFARWHAPAAWLVDVPAWDLRARLELTGEHRGHGPARSDGRRPIYAQIGVNGEASIAGVRQRVFGMVELIRD